MKYLERDNAVRGRKFSHAAFMADMNSCQGGDEKVHSKKLIPGIKTAYAVGTAIGISFFGITTPLAVNAESLRAGQSEPDKGALSDESVPNKGVSDAELKIAIQSYVQSFTVRESKPAPTPEPKQAPEMMLVGGNTEQEDQLSTSNDNSSQQTENNTTVSGNVASEGLSPQLRALLDKADIQKVPSPITKQNNNIAKQPEIISSVNKNKPTPVSTVISDATNINSDTEDVEPNDENIPTRTPVPTSTPIPTSTPSPKPSPSPKKEAEQEKNLVEVKPSKEYGEYGFHLDGFYDKDEIVSCGSAANPSNNCGHGGIGYPKVCIPGRYSCVKDAKGNLTYTEALKKGNDIRPSGVKTGLNNYQLNFPYAITEKGATELTWSLYSGPRTIGSEKAPLEWGYGYVFKADLDSNHYILWNVAHVNRINSVKVSKSGEKVSSLWSNLDGNNKSHSHISFKIVEKNTGKVVLVEPKDLGIGKDHKLKELLEKVN